MSVVIPKKGYLTLVAASVRYANTRIEKEDWLEVSGILIGRNEGKKKNEKVIVTSVYTIMHQLVDKDAVIDKYEWTHEDMVVTAELETQAYLRNEFIVGWWHSHPGFKIMMSDLDKKTTLSYQTNNPLAFSLVFNPLRLIQQVEMASRKGDPAIQLTNDPGFKIFRLSEIGKGVHVGYHEVDFEIEGIESMEQLVKEAQDFVKDVTNFFPKDNLFETYDKFVKKRVTQLNSLLLGTEEYLKTLVRKGERSRVPEVLENQKKEINRYVAQTFMKIENMKEFMDYLEYKERDTVIPQVNEILSEWDETIANLNERLVEISNKF